MTYPINLYTLQHLHKHIQQAQTELKQASPFYAMPISKIAHKTSRIITGRARAIAAGFENGFYAAPSILYALDPAFEVSSLFAKRFNHSPKKLRIHFKCTHVI